MSVRAARSPCHRASRRPCGPRRFDQAQEVADRFKEGQPVIMNIEGAEREVARRLIDFASGLCYALDGSMEKVATGVYLLKPISSRAAATTSTTTDARRSRVTPTGQTCRTNVRPWR